MRFFVGYGFLDFFIPWSNSLKAKRKFMRSFMDRIKQKYGLVVSEVADRELWQRGKIAFATVSHDPAYIEKLFNKVFEEAFSQPEAQLISHFWDVQSVDIF